MQFLWCTINVKDIEASLRFYEQIVGLSVVRRFGEPGAQLAFLGDGETKVELIQGKAAPVNGGGVSIGFQVDNLENKIAFVEAHGVPVQSGPFSPSPRTRFFFIADPDGVLVQFVEQKNE